jgi:hypothetical protein
MKEKAHWSDSGIGDTVYYRFRHKLGGKGVAKTKIVGLVYGIITLADGSKFSRYTGRAVSTEPVVQAGPGYVDEWTPLRLLKPGLANW